MSNRHTPRIHFALAKPNQGAKLEEDDTDSLNRTKEPEESSSSRDARKNVPLLASGVAEKLQNYPDDVESHADNRKKRKRSRWDQGDPDREAAPTSKTDAGQALLSHSPLQSSADSDSPPSQATTAGSRSAVYTSDKRQFARTSDTFKPGMIRVGSKWVYPEDEITKGGTWEHKKRAEEMKRTADEATRLTVQAEVKRAHHIADFLPKDELKKFQKKVAAVKTGGEEPAYEDYESNKLDQSNIGFKMLQKQGWQAGSGLGKSGEGIAAPVNKAEARPDGAGLGQDKPDGVEEDDDEFEIYRKRMMLAYKFRPNPLVRRIASSAVA